MSSMRIQDTWSLEVNEMKNYGRPTVVTSFAPLAFALLIQLKYIAIFSYLITRLAALYFNQLSVGVMKKN